MRYIFSEMNKFEGSLYLPRTKVKIEVPEEDSELVAPKSEENEKTEDQDTEARKDSFRQVVGNQSKIAINDKLMERLSKCTIALLSKSIPDVAQTAERKSGRLAIHLSDIGKSMRKDIYEYYRFVNEAHKLSVSEMVVSFIFMRRLVERDCESRKETAKGFVSFDSYTSNIFNSICLAIKFVEGFNGGSMDPLSREKVGQQLSTSYSSESEFLRAINCECSVNKKEFQQAFEELVNPFYGAKGFAEKWKH
ncbi:uncharacterized protein MONOS_1006 [Monocercomonoides exilis]|uniref:uncharacterized protein n=1 Tax=Monocercomonoides exilis TaxID=2049356 RepID=UPI003559A832|nr:hypothetical protein MONOS_1006 [Monocercomonoides exilis]|eukprot:MONOS_1006.1-p1 / transcript=MONOS_1006.1 / gene=MONOS_1006 / organism=Monocercomonoides_exilis_PA203 / gene_product=unspecified product / transcript_product=unspecified product / location=Mono_scaffold00017:4439-5241(+) / protein_length=250 / sequence_SO=supercontig / SO=protein_coding / is_pseudo=false